MNIKYIAIGLVVGLGILIATGNMGGARKATGNYIDVRKNAGVSSGEARPSPLAQMIEYNKSKNK
jgi:hypothetical protein